MPSPVSSSDSSTASARAAGTSVSGGSPRILVVRLSAIGDCLHSLPLVETLRAQLPSAYIGWVLQRPTLDLIDAHPAVDRTHEFPRRRPGLGSKLAALRVLRRELREEHYDVALDTQGLTKSGFAAWLSGAKRRIGLRGPASRELNALFMTQRILPDPRRPHVVDRNLDLVRELVGTVPEVGAAPTGTPWIDQQAAVTSFVRSLPEDRRLVVLNPGTTWRTKLWPESSYQMLASRLHDAGFCVVLTWGDAEEQGVAQQIASASEAVVAPGTNLVELADLIRRAHLFVSNDTGPLHLAAAVGTPTLGLYGPTDPERNGPYGSHTKSLVLEPSLDCQFCWKRTCKRGDHACLERLSPDTVHEAAMRLADRQ